MSCHACGGDALTSILDLGASPPCSRFLTPAQLDDPEPSLPLHLRLCTDCLLLQVPALLSPDDNFVDYAYYSSFSSSWVAHAARLVDEAATRLSLGPGSRVIEVASNDGYLLQHAVERGFTCLGVEPSVNCGEAARARGIPTETAFLDEATALRLRHEHGAASWVVANNVWAHVPDVAGFTRALRTLVADDGLVSIEVHHALSLVRDCQFDTIYHEHFSYWTLLAARPALAAAGLHVIDVELIPTHGGSLRIWASPDADHLVEPSVDATLAAERAADLDRPSGYAGMAERVADIRDGLVSLLIDCRSAGLRVAGYGAPGKGNTLLNYAGIRPDLIEYLVDRNDYKHQRFTPGTRIRVLPPEHLDADRPDVIVVLPWNLREEITTQLAPVADWGAYLVFAQPELTAVDPTTGKTATGDEARTMIGLGART